VYELILFALSLFAAFAIGANNASACVGAVVGAGLMNQEKALALAGAGMATGILLEGWKMKPSIVGKLLLFSDPKINACLLLSSLIVLLMVTLFAIPLSFSQALVGGAVGIGALEGTLNSGFALVVGSSWVYAPLMSIPVAALIYVFLKKALPKGIFQRARVNAFLVLASSFYVAYVLGANTVGLLEGFSSTPVTVAGPSLALASFLGSFVAGKKVTKTVSEDIVGISPVASSGASFGGALVVELMTQLAVPVSVSQIGVAALFGPSLAHKATVSNRSKVLRIIFVWALAPIFGFALAVGLYSVMPNGLPW
jgi:PiT family inorganic phosphate transporter